MEIMVCPYCKRAFYAEEKNYIFCPYCRHAVLERRAHKRVRKSADFSFTLGGRKRKAALKDYSSNGAKIVYKGEALSVGTVLKIDIHEVAIHRKGRTVWTRNSPGSMKVSGLRLL